MIFFSFFPIILLIYLMTKKNSVPSFKALPIVALILYGLSLFVFKREPTLIHASIIHGLLTALTPITIIWGAIMLFRTMGASGSMAVIQSWLNTISRNQVAQLMIVGWAFPFLIEGASGFGTPVALAAPVLVGLGFNPLKTAILVLIMDSVPVSFGAVGTPTWFGLSGVPNLNQETIIEIGIKSVIMHAVAAYIIPIIALLFVVKPKEIKENIGFIYLSISATIIPYVLIGFYSYEFPSLIGGGIGLILSVFFAKKDWGLKSVANKNVVNKIEQIPIRKLIKASFPLYGTIFILIITRVQQLGIKQYLIGNNHTLNFNLGYLGVAHISNSLVVSLTKILNTNISWAHKILYIPSLIPFGLISAISFIIYKMNKDEIKKVCIDSMKQIMLPSITLFGALIFVDLMMLGGMNSCVSNIGKFLADTCGQSWQFFAAYMGAIGTFFSGSNTISNLTFGGIQNTIAQSLNLNRTTILALQSVGGAMGNMVCVNSIVAVCSVLSIHRKEGIILKCTVGPMILYGIIVALVSLLI